MALFDPSLHEPPTGRAWDADRVGAAIVEIVERTDAAFDDRELWPPHPLDLEGGPLERVKTLYLGAAGVIWALHELERLGAAELGRDWRGVATSLVERYLAEPDFQELVEGPVPSLWAGETGVLLVAHTLSPAAWLEERLLDAVHANAANPTWELMWGSPGTMLAAQIVHERIGGERWRAAWRASADLLWNKWREGVWEQRLYGSRLHVLGPAHGFAGNVFVLARGGLLEPERREELERRTLATLERHALREGDLAQWPPSLEPSSVEGRVQWCHGAPGIVCSLAGLASGDEALTDLLRAGGELTWRAGPLRKGASLCHGTAGNGYAFLKLFERTGDELWLERARTFAMHAIDQIAWALAQHGQGRHSLWTGDPGTALYLQSCLDGEAAFPTLDRF